MISDNNRNAYQEIKAPETLRARVAASAAEAPARRSPILPRMLAAAAILVIFVVAGALILPAKEPVSDAYISFNGQPISTAFALPEQNTSDIKFLGVDSLFGLRLEVYTRSAATLKAVNSTVILVENGKLSQEKTSVELSGNADPYTVYWRADFRQEDEEVPFRLILTDAKGSVSYALTDVDGELMLQKDPSN